MITPGPSAAIMEKTLSVFDSQMILPRRSSSTAGTRVGWLTQVMIVCPLETTLAARLIVAGAV